MMAVSGIFSQWVRKDVHLLLLVILVIPLTVASGVVGSASVYMVGSLSAIPADITMATYAYTVGLVLGVPFILSLKQVITSRNILLGVFAGLIVINIVLGSTDQPLILVMGSFAVGFLKIIGLLEVLVSMIPILMPQGERYRFYAVYYPVSLVFAQLATMAVVYIADKYNWQFGQMVLVIPQLFGMLLVLVFVHPYRTDNKTPIYTFDWLGLLLTAICMLLLDFILSYGLTEDWLHSTRIGIGIVFFLASLFLLIGRTFIVEKPFLDLSVLEFRNVRIGLIAMFLLGLFFATSFIQNIMMNVILKGNPVEVTRINLYMIPGFIAATPIGYFYYKKHNGLKIIVALVGICYLIYFIQLFFLTSPATNSSDFYLPMFFRGTAILLSYMAIGIYMADGMTPAQAVSVLFYNLTLRIFIGPAIWSAALGYVYYHRLIYNVNMLASKTDSNDQLYSDVFNSFYKNDVSAGNSLDQARNLATKSIFNSIQSQATLLTVRDVLGAIIVLGILMIGTLMFLRVDKVKPGESGDRFTPF